MAILPAFLLMAQAPSAPQVRLEVPVLNRRPSKISGILNEMNGGNPSLRVFVVPNDEASLLTLVGAKDEVEVVQRLIGLFDTAPRKVRLGLRVESPLDHAEWKAEVEVNSEAGWTGEDEATGVRLRVATRVNDDGTCTVFAKAESKDTSPVSMVFRIRRGESQSFTLPLLRKGPAEGKAPRFSLKYAE